MTIITEPVRNKFIDRVTYLRITSHIGISFGARHFYGVLENNGNDYELQNILTASHAAELNQHEIKLGYKGTHKVGDRYSGFLTKDEIKKLGINMYRFIYPESDILLLGWEMLEDIPTHCIDGPADIMEQINMYADTYDIRSQHEPNDKSIKYIRNAYWTYLLGVKKNRGLPQT